MLNIILFIFLSVLRCRDCATRAGKMHPSSPHKAVRSRGSPEIRDSVVSVAACSRSCTATPWRRRISFVSLRTGLSSSEARRQPFETGHLHLSYYARYGRRNGGDAAACDGAVLYHQGTWQRHVPRPLLGFQIARSHVVVRLADEAFCSNRLASELTSRCPLESTVSAGHWCSRSTRAATGFADRKK
jgi:hypothetical protein